MDDATPDTPESLEAESTSPYISIASKKFHQAADRALDHYLNPTTLLKTNPPNKPGTVFVVAPNVNTEALLVQACDSMASASVMASDFAAVLEGAHRKTMMALQQIIMLGELAVNRMLDDVEPPHSST